jgi:hypothetical protein
MVEVGKKENNLKKLNFIFIPNHQSPLLDDGGFAKQGITKYSPNPNKVHIYHIKLGIKSQNKLLRNCTK